MPDKSLNAKQLRFIDEYLVDLNATQAAIRAGYSPKTARQQGQRLLSHVDIRREVDERRSELAEKADYDLQAWLKGNVAIATSDIRRLFDPDTGRVLEPWELDDVTAQAVSSIEVEEIYEGEPGNRTCIGHKKKFKFWNKGQAQDRLAKYLGAYEEDNRQRGMIFSFDHMSVEQLRDYVQGQLEQGVTIEGQFEQTD